MQGEASLIHEECGVFGIFGPEGTEAAAATYYGLFSLQHRGQESCGIAVNDQGDVHVYKDMGLVSDVFSQPVVDSLVGKAAIGHVRYSTTGQSVRENAQPLVTRYSKGTLAIAHNGNLSNTVTLRQQLEDQGAIFQTTIDSEIVAYLIARYRSKAETVEEAVALTMEQLEGAYCLLVLSRGKLIAARDPLGFRPLCIGQLGEAIVFASESCALDTVGATFIRDVEPGEIVVVDKSGMRSLKTQCRDRRHHCIFEYIYFARSDSTLDSVSVYEARLRAGRLLAEQYPVEADIVLGVPDSGLDAAMGYSMASGIPLVRGFVKNNYVGRTFIKPTQSQRENAVRIKLNPVRSSVEGKRVVMVDDSIVRGTTSARIVQQLKQAGATQVHVRISAPPFLWPCYFGTDIPSTDQLTARRHTHDEICQMIGADSLGFLKLDSLHEMMGEKEKHYCDACFSGYYPSLDPEAENGLVYAMEAH
ncbi:MAG: amidophosphoribosyltransferase [Clostridia bacterium]|nr:amidophosphoribosyltransferase [Clostridia bacterium]NCC74826.1 amidophosphoribosyltransferase [Clostridia bacterium]